MLAVLDKFASVADHTETSLVGERTFFGQRSPSAAAEEVTGRSTPSARLATISCPPTFHQVGPRAKPKFLGTSV